MKIYVYFWLRTNKAADGVCLCLFVHACARVCVTRNRNVTLFRKCKIKSQKHF